MLLFGNAGDRRMQVELVDRRAAGQIVDGVSGSAKPGCCTDPKRACMLQAKPCHFAHGVAQVHRDHFFLLQLPIELTNHYKVCGRSNLHNLKMMQRFIASDSARRATQSGFRGPAAAAIRAACDGPPAPTGPGPDTSISEPSPSLGSTRTHSRLNSARSVRPAVSSSTTSRPPCSTIFSASVGMPRSTKERPHPPPATRQKSCTMAAPWDQKNAATPSDTRHKDR